MSAPRPGCKGVDTPMLQPWTQSGDARQCSCDTCSCGGAAAESAVHPHPHPQRITHQPACKHHTPTANTSEPPERGFMCDVPLPARQQLIHTDLLTPHSRLGAWPHAHVQLGTCTQRDSGCLCFMHTRVMTEHSQLMIDGDARKHSGTLCLCVRAVVPAAEGRRA